MLGTNVYQDVFRTYNIKTNDFTVLENENEGSIDKWEEIIREKNNLKIEIHSGLTLLLIIGIRMS